MCFQIVDQIFFDYLFLLGQNFLNRLVCLDQENGWVSEKSKSL